MKFAICNEIFYTEDAEHWTIPRQFETAAELGFDGIEIAPFTLADHVAEITDEQKNQIVTASQQSGVEVAGIHWLLVGPEGMHVTSPDPEVREHTARYMEELVRFGIEIGGTMMVVGSPKQRDIREGVNYEDAWAWFKDTMKRCGEVGVETDFKICIEPLATVTQNNFLRQAHEVVRMSAEINLPNVGVILDTYSGVKEERDLPEAIRASKDYLFHYHCNDGTGYAPGYGDTDFVGPMEALLDIGFQRFASIEVFKFDIPAVEHARTGLKTLMDAVEKASSRNRE
jgi:sugar phosphate isomerase/epimerase